MLAPAAPTARRFLDRHFRWRRTEVTRMEGFADAVFGFVLTLLFLQARPPENLGELKTAMSSLLPFGVTFLLLTMIWIDHHRFFRRYGLDDKTTFFGNLWLLFLVLVYAYPLKFLFTLLFVMWVGPLGAVDRTSMGVGGEPEDGLRLMMFYGGGFGTIYATFALLYRHALARADDLGLDDVERHLTVSSILECWLLVGFAALSFTFAVCGSVQWSGWVYFGIGPSMGVLGWRRGNACERLLRARAA